MRTCKKVGVAATERRAHTAAERDGQRERNVLCVCVKWRRADSAVERPPRALSWQHISPTGSRAEPYRIMRRISVVMVISS